MFVAFSARVDFVFIGNLRVRLKCNSGVDDAYLAADLGEAFNEGEHIGVIKVIENPQTKDDIKMTVLFVTKVADVVLEQLQVVELQNVFDKSGLLNIRFAALDPHGVRA